MRFYGRNNFCDQYGRRYRHAGLPVATRYHHHNPAVCFLPAESVLKSHPLTTDTDGNATRKRSVAALRSAARPPCSSMRPSTPHHYSVPVRQQGSNRCCPNEYPPRVYLCDLQYQPSLYSQYLYSSLATYCRCQRLAH